MLFHLNGVIFNSGRPIWGFQWQILMSKEQAGWHYCAEIYLKHFNKVHRIAHLNEHIKTEKSALSCALEVL